jgi:hypothetical protein
VRLPRLRRRRETTAPDEQPEIAPIYGALRDAILNLDPGAAGIAPTAELPNVWGLVMDWSMDTGVATIVSLADGTTSMYLSSGGGSVGAGAHEGPARASVRAVRVAESMIEAFRPSQSAPIPEPGRIALTLLTFSGRRRVEEDATDFQDGTAVASPVANAMQEVIEAIRSAQGASASVQ